jgi:hypothetical protein
MTPISKTSARTISLRINFNGRKRRKRNQKKKIQRRIIINIAVIIALFEV